MTFFEVLLNILAIIFIVAVGGAVIYLLGSFILSLIESKKPTEKTVEKEVIHETHHVVDTFETNPAIRESKIASEKLSLNNTEEVKSVDFEAAQQEKKELEKEHGTLETVKAESPVEIDDSLEEATVEEGTFVMPEDEVKETKTEETKETSKEDDFNNLFDDEKDFNFDDFDFDSFFDEQSAEEKKNDEKKAENSAPVQVETVTEPVSQQVETVDDDFEFSAPIETSAQQEIAQTTENTSVIQLPADNAQSVEEISELDFVAPTQQNQVTTVENNSVTENNQFVSNTTTNTVNTTNETIKTIVVENKALEDMLRSEIAELRVELEEQKKLYAELKSQSYLKEEKWEQEKSELEKLYEEAEAREVEKPKALLTLEEYQSRLDVLRERLRINERDLKLNRKEFLPLRRVRKNLDKDKSKLRRREALVAKQKVLLYGVNNIMEIDQEKAKKLAEDLDLLDGLKVSVRHCEEVMEANKERYPILETANRILTTAHEEIKSDIEECENAIRELKLANGDIDAGAELTPNAMATNNEPPKRKRGRPRKNATQQPTVSETIATDNKDKVVHSAETERVENESEETDFNPEQLFDIVSSEEVENVEQAKEEKEVEKETEKEEIQEVDLSKLFVEPEETAVEVADNDVEVVPESKKIKNSAAQITESKETKITQTNVEVREEKKGHKFNFDALEPSMEDLFAIENENWFEDEE